MIGGMSYAQYIVDNVDNNTKYCETWYPLLDIGVKTGHLAVMPMQDCCRAERRGFRYVL